MNPIVETTYGKLEGSEENDLFVFRGIPYAAAPTGALRWCPPVEPLAWAGVRPARAFGPACPQPSLEDRYGSVIAVGATDEDCLYLNVWSPALQDGGARPVMVYIHGGGFRIGAGSLAHYNGSALARRGDVVVVTINYRLGPFGFVHLDGPTQGAVPATGNEGLLDVVAALRWVQANVDAFGGDPANVTIFGQSAGGMSVAALLTMTSAAGLYHKAIMQSAPGALTFDRDQASALGAEMIEGLGVGATDSEALLNEFRFRVPTTRLLDAHRRHQSAVYHYVFSWCSPTGDGAVKARHHTDTGIMFGTHDIDDQHAEMFGQGPAADALAAAMQDAWAAFARNGNPSSSTLGDWPVYGEDRSTMFIGERTHVVQAPYEAERQALATVSNELMRSV